MMMLRFVLAVAFLTFPRCGAITRMLKQVHKNYPDFHPNAIIDVGANMGFWSAEANQIFPDVKLLLLEASPQHNETLAKVVEALWKNADYRIGVLSATAGDKVNFFQGGNTGNSMFRENTKHYEKDKSVERITHTLDSMVESSHLKNERIDVIKVDVQGAELVAFQGARKALSQATFVYFEGSTIEYNEGGSCLYEVDEFLRSQGYFLYDLGAFGYNNVFKTQGLGQFDVMYVRPDSEQLPHYLKTSGVQFCGHRKTKASTNSSSPESPAASISTGAGWMPEEYYSKNKEWKETGFVETWASGFLIGVVACMLVTRLFAKRDGKHAPSKRTPVDV